MDPNQDTPAAHGSPEPGHEGFTGFVISEEEEAFRESPGNTYQGPELADYASHVGDPQWPETDLYRAIVCGLPRTLHSMRTARRREVLSRAPPLTGTPWDAMIAAVAEHSANRHGDPHYVWMDEPERFLDIPWMPCVVLPVMHWEALLFTPGAFARHGALVHPGDLDERSGDPRWEPVLR